MTTVEFNNEFDVQYNAVVGANNPALDLYEKSIYLTRAQLEIVKNKYDFKANRKQEGFEASEKRRVDLNNLVKQYSTSTKIKNEYNIGSNSRFIDLPKDVMFIVNEQLRFSDGDCEFDVLVQPITSDEYNIQKDNPFKKPTKLRAWRLDYSSNNSRRVEIVYINDKYTYSVRYIKYPQPIILTNLSIDYPNEGLSIDGITTISECELNENLHPEILNRAVELAMADYTNNNLEAKLQLNTRDE